MVDGAPALSFADDHICLVSVAPKLSFCDTDFPDNLSDIASDVTYDNPTDFDCPDDEFLCDHTFQPNDIFHSTTIQDAHD